MKIANNVEMLEINSRSGVIYPTLVWDENQVVLIDTGYPLEVDLLDAEMQKAGFSVGNVDVIILTHQDIDHVGCVKEIADRSGALILAHENEIPYINGDKTPVKVEEMAKYFDAMTKEDQIWYLNLKKAFENRRVDVDQALKDGEMFNVGEGLEIIHTPGHTPGHICVYVKGSKVLIAGDSLNIRDGKLSGADPKYSQNMDLAERSLQKLKKYDTNWVVTYHGGVMKIDGKIEV